MATGHFNPDAFDTFTPEEYKRYTVETLKFGWIAQIIAVAAICMAKICIIFFLHNVIGGAHHAKPWFLWIVGISNIIIGTVIFTLLLTQCSPVEGLWEVFGPRDCRNERQTQGFAYFAASTYRSTPKYPTSKLTLTGWSVLSDVALAVYPAPIIWSLQLRKRTKIGLCVLLSLVVIAGACAAVKTYELRLMVGIERHSYEVAPLLALTMAETWITFIVACVAPSAPLIKLAISRIWSSAATSNLTGNPNVNGRQAVHPTFGLHPMSQFQSLAYAVGDVKDIYGLNDNSSKQSIIRDVIDGKGIAVQTNVEIQYDGKQGDYPLSRDRMSPSITSHDGHEAYVMDRV